MVNTKTLIERDLQHIWHPCSQMKDFEQCPPLIVHRAEGAYLETDRGSLIDASSSWWCKSLGHRHPEVIEAIQTQLEAFEHVIGANTTYPKLVELGETLASITNKQHAFFASDGSCAVEIAMKLALHANQLKGTPERNEFVSLKNSYHGETIATLAVSDLGLYKAPYESLGVSCHFLQPLPYVTGQEDPLWNNCDFEWSQVLEHLEAIKDKVCAILVEPLMQGAGGMRCYSAAFLKHLSEFAKAHDIYLIADEIMTGLGRTGEWLACDHASVEPDMVCLSKGLTSGTLPLSTVCIDDAIYQYFYDDYESGKSFLHSHTYSGNPLAVSAAVATLKVMKREAIPECASQLGKIMRAQFEAIANISGKISNIRSLGAMVAGDLEPVDSKRLGFHVYQRALEKGALLRPLGNTIYWLPPLTTNHKTIGKLGEITLNSIEEVYK